MDNSSKKITFNGYEEWWSRGKLHREDGPAVEWNDGTKAWYRNGHRHREDGPAIEYSNGDTSWYLNGKFFKFDQWCQHLRLTDEEIAIIKLQYV